MDELKPCPFCGGKAAMEQTSYGTDPQSSARLSFRINCTKCGATAPGANGYVSVILTCSGYLNALHDDRENAIKKWNRRASDPTPEPLKED